MTRIAKIEIDFDLDAGKAQDVRVNGASSVSEEVAMLLETLRMIFER